MVEEEKLFGWQKRIVVYLCMGCKGQKKNLPERFDEGSRA